MLETVWNVDQAYPGDSPYTPTPKGGPENVQDAMRAANCADGSFRIIVCSEYDSDDQLLKYQSCCYKTW